MKLRNFLNRIRKDNLIKDIKNLEATTGTITTLTSTTATITTGTITTATLTTATVATGTFTGNLNIPVTNSPVTATGSFYVSGDGSYMFVRVAGAWKSGALA